MQLEYNINNKMSTKNRLARIRTTVDEQGNYDHDQYFKQQKYAYQRQIDLSIRVDTITEQQFSLRPLQIGFMNSSVLKDQQKFKDIKKILIQYNKSIIERGSNAVKGLHLKKVVMEAMIKFMSLMMLAPDAQTKKIILDIAYHWFMRQLDPKSSKKSTRELHQQIRDLVMQKNILPIDIVNRQLILNKVNEQLHPYRIKARTMYKQLNDPKVQLQSYNTHKLQFMSENMMKGIQGKDKNKKKWIQTVKFPKIQPLSYSIQEYPQQKDQKNQLVQDNKNGAVTNTDTQKTQQAQPQIEGQPVVQLDAEGKPIVPANVNEQPQQDLDFGAEPQGDPQPQQLQEQPEDKKKGKLDPLLKVFILQRIRAKQKQDAACNKVRQKQMNKKNITYEQDVLQGNYIRDWAKQRARIKTQVSRRNQSMRGTEQRVRGKDQSLTNKTATTFLQNDVDKIRMESTISDYKKNITAVQVPPDKLNYQAGQSLYDGRRVRTQASHKPFSSILTDYSKKVEQNLMADEIANIKQKFAKYKVYGQMDKLIKGLAPPDWQYIQDTQKIAWPNSQMLSNPFIKVAKKKKKKKKK